MSALEIDGVTIVADIADAHFSGEEVPETVEHPETGETIARIGWHRTDAWRGYHEATPADGWRVVGQGTSCGSWDDAPTGTSDAEVLEQLRRLADEHGEIVVVLCGTSNVFSLGFDVLARGAS